MLADEADGEVARVLGLELDAGGVAAALDDAVELRAMAREMTRTTMTSEIGHSWRPPVRELAEGLAARETVMWVHERMAM